MKENQLKEIVSELLTRPGHEKVRGDLLRLLTDGLGAASTDITFEQQLNHRPTARQRKHATIHHHIDALVLPDR
jgi:hypothetical protein